MLCTAASEKGHKDPVHAMLLWFLSAFPHHCRAGRDSKGFTPAVLVACNSYEHGWSKDSAAMGR